MKQKIVIRVQFVNCDKCRSKALKIAAIARGVSSVSLEGADRDEVVVIGDGVDSFCLAKALRKKFRHANIIKLEEVKDKDDDKDDGKDKEEEKLPPYFYGYYPPCPPCVTYENPYGSNCIIM